MTTDLSIEQKNGEIPTVVMTLQSNWSEIEPQEYETGPSARCTNPWRLLQLRRRIRQRSVIGELSQKPIRKRIRAHAAEKKAHTQHSTQLVVIYLITVVLSAGHVDT